MNEPYEQWQRMDNYFCSFLLENQVDCEVRCKINHFRLQYLLKVTNFVREEAAILERDISPWVPFHRGNYHRCYSNPLLFAVESEMGAVLRQGPDAFALVNRHEFLGFETSQVRGQKVASLPRGRDKKGLLDAIIRGGYTPSLQDTAAMAASFNLFKENPEFKFPLQKKGCRSIRELLAHPIMSRFREQNGSSAIVFALLEGFSTLSIDPFFSKKKCSLLLHDSYGRVLHSIEESMKIPINSYFALAKFENYMDLIYEEMIFWLLFAEPYASGDLEKHIQTLIKPAPFFRSLQTGMSAFSEIIQVLLKKRAVILAFDDCYYESLQLLKEAHIVRGPDYKISLQEQLKQLKKIDILLVDFHNNVLPGKMRTERHDVAAIFDQVLPYASDSIALVIDNTIGYLNSNEINDLLAAFPNHTIIVYWSHQKFDLFGTDKVSGGSYAVYSKDEELLSQFREVQGGEIDSVSRQVLTHFFRFGARLLEERKERVFANGWYANQKIDPRIQGVVKKGDSLCFSVDIHLDRAGEREGEILRHFHERGVPLASRLSFGFNISSQTIVKERVMRFSLGAEDQEYIDQWIDVFNSLFLNES